MGWVTHRGTASANGVMKLRFPAIVGAALDTPYLLAPDAIVAWGATAGHAAADRQIKRSKLN